RLSVADRCPPFPMAGHGAAGRPLSRRALRPCVAENADGAERPVLPDHRRRRGRRDPRGLLGIEGSFRLRQAASTPAVSNGCTASISESLTRVRALRKASTQFGSNWLPALRRSSAAAATSFTAF